MRSLFLATLLLTACGGGTSGEATELANYEPSLDAPADVAAPPADAKKTESGLAYKILKKGPGEDPEMPESRSRVEVHYTGWTTDGKRFDSSRERGTPTKFGLTQVIKGWTEGLQMMTRGDHYRFWIPEDLAYGGRPGKPAGMLVFDVELIDITTPPKPVPPPEAPADVASPPADAQKTDSGLAYKVLKKGPGGPKPTDKAIALVHYAGWTTDGKNFDYSRKRGAPASFGVGSVIPGWTEGLQLMEAGDHYRLWIPEELAYKGQPNRPAGMLVFDVELLEVHEPPDLSVPADAKKTESGLQWKLLSEPSTDSQKPTGAARIKANWTGWSADMGGFDSNIGRPPGDFTARTRQLKGLNEGVQLLGKGEKARFWLPEDLAFNGREGAPKAPIVYDVELVSFVEIAKKGNTTPVQVGAPPKAKVDVKPMSTKGVAPQQKGVGTAAPAPAPAGKGVGSTKAPAPAGKGVGDKK